MKISPTLVIAAAVLIGGCSKKETAAVKTNETASGNPLTAPVDYLGAVAKAKRVAERSVDTVSVNQAIQMFYAQEDRFPKDLNELIAKRYIAAIPAPPAGTRWSYNPRTGDIKAIKQP